MPFSVQKMQFFDKKCNIYPCPTSSNFDVKKLFFPLVFFYLNSEGFFIASYSTWWNPPLNIFNWAKNVPIFERFEKNGNGTFFLEGNFTPIWKKWALLGKNAQAILTLPNLAQKVRFLEDLKKKVSKSDWNQRHIVYVTQIHYFTWF